MHILPWSNGTRQTSWINLNHLTFLPRANVFGNFDSSWWSYIRPSASREVTEAVTEATTVPSWTNAEMSWKIKGSPSLSSCSIFPPCRLKRAKKESWAGGRGCGRFNLRRNQSRRCEDALCLEAVRNRIAVVKRVSSVRNCKKKLWSEKETRHPHACLFYFLISRCQKSLTHFCYWERPITNSSKPCIQQVVKVDASVKIYNQVKGASEAHLDISGYIWAFLHVSAQDSVLEELRVGTLAGGVAMKPWSAIAWERAQQRHFAKSEWFDVIGCMRLAL